MAKKPSDVIVVEPEIVKVILSISNFKVPRSAKMGGSVIYSQSIEQLTVKFLVANVAESSPKVTYLTL